MTESHNLIESRSTSLPTIFSLVQENQAAAKQEAMIESEECPGYLRLLDEGCLSDRVRILERILAKCVLCPRQCGADRLKGKVGACGVDARPKVAAMSIHPWEEPPISGTQGSGTIFFSGCTLKCLFCQNYPISQLGVGRYISVEQLADGMLKLQQRGAHNINLVTATHQIPAVAAAIMLAATQGLSVPIVYNTSGYERTEILRLLDGLVDIYLPDIKYADGRAAEFCSQRKDYVIYNRPALLEMWRQVGALQVDQQGIARRGLLVRHMVLPANLSGTHQCLNFLAKEMGSSVWISLMSQYFPAHQALRSPPLDRKPSAAEYREAFQALIHSGLENGFMQDWGDNGHIS